MEKHSLYQMFFVSALLLILAIIAFAGWKVDFLAAQSGSKVLFRIPILHGASFATHYLHSVEHTNVEDEYKVSDRYIWSWEERVKSSNAGMPSVLPKYMRFYNDGENLIFRGGRIAQQNFALRVGNETFGRNSITLPRFGKKELYKIAPGRRIILSAEKHTLLQHGCVILP